MGDRTIRTKKGKYKISRRMEMRGRLRWKYAGKLFAHASHSEIHHPEHVTWICEAGKHCAPRYYCTDSNGRDIETLGEE